MVPDPPVAATGTPVNEPAARHRQWRWADLMRRAFDLDVLTCPRCRDRMRPLATIDAPLVIEPILAHLGCPRTARARTRRTRRRPHSSRTSSPDPARPAGARRFGSPGASGARV